MNELFDETSENVVMTKAKRSKGSTFQTVSALYRVRKTIIFQKSKQAAVIVQKVNKQLSLLGNYHQ